MYVKSLYATAAYMIYTVKAAVLQCNDVLAPVTVAATVRQFPANFDRTTFNYTTVPDLPDTQVSGTYQIAASYCEPGAANGTRHDTLQILVSGITYTRTYWSGLGHPPQSYAPISNSWIDFASDQGYSTLAIDRLCNGNSTHPDGALACQTENQVAVLKALVEDAKCGRFGGRTFTNVILVGHSYGSLLVEAFTRLYPSEVRAVVLTGFTDIITQGIQAQASVGSFNGTPASQVDPTRFGSLDSNYFVLNNETVFIGSFYTGSFNLSVAQHDYNTTGTFNFYEVATAQIGQLVVSNYTGSVIVLNGELDAAVCRGDCGEGTSSLTQQISALYPAANGFWAYNTENTGHCLNLHTSSPESFQVIFDELDKQGF